MRHSSAAEIPFWQPDLDLGVEFYEGSQCWGERGCWRMNPSEEE